MGSKREADLKIGAWLSSALEDPSTCQSMKDDINEWFECTHQEETDRLRAKKKQIYEDLKDAVDREWVGLSYRDVMGIFERWDFNRDRSLVQFNKLELCELFELVEAKLKENNT